MQEEADRRLVRLQKFIEGQLDIDLKGVTLIGLPSPQEFMSPGTAIRCGTQTASLGSPVWTVEGRRAVVTAGHATKRNARVDLNGSVPLGNVTTHMCCATDVNGMPVPPKQLMPDIAVISLDQPIQETPGVAHGELCITQPFTLVRGSHRHHHLTCTTETTPIGERPQLGDTFDVSSGPPIWAG